MAKVVSTYALDMDTIDFYNNLYVPSYNYANTFGVSSWYVQNNVHRTIGNYSYEDLLVNLLFPNNVCCNQC